ncbi:hypothetical protein KC19_N030900 [Ceratodon purpureus]|nr:hypothetical protein KC19_N030900 [Ceratodon purpureus]
MAMAPCCVKGMVAVSRVGKCRDLIGTRKVEILNQVNQKRRQLAVRCDADSNASASTSRRPRELLVPVSQLVEARVIFAAAPAMGHNQEGHPECNARVPSILEALEKGELTPEVSFEARKF